MLVMQMALKWSDIGHLAAAIDVHKRWIMRLEEVRMHIWCGA